MYYAIDMDSLTVESKSKSAEDILDYIQQNKLEIAVILVETEDDLALEFTVDEIAGLYENTCGREIPNKDSEESAAELTMAVLNKYQDDFPNFTKTLGKKLAKKGSEQSAEKSSSGKVSKPSGKGKKPTESVSRKRIKLDYDHEIAILDGKSKNGSILHTIVTAVEDEMCVTVGEVVEYITSNHTIPKTGELADVKFAEHNIKYFYKQGKISIEEGL